MSVIELNDVSVTFHEGGRTVEAVKHVSLSVDKGEIFAIVVFSGAGKSTLVRTINLLERPTGGRVLIDGNDITGLTGAQLRELRKNIGFIFQGFNLITNVTVGKNIEFALKAGGYPKSQRQDRIRELLTLVGLENKIDSYPSSLSGGQKQRVSIARALANEPEILLCDEATSALDPNTTQAILRLLKQINQTLGVTIVVITHEMRVIEQICRRVAVIDQSCIAEIGNVSDVFTHPKSDIAKALILPKSPAENLPPCTGKRLRLVFDGSCSNEPVISRITLECGVPVNILFADTRIVEGSIYGHMVIDLPSDPQQFHNVLRWLEHNHISYLQEV